MTHSHQSISLSLSSLSDNDVLYDKEVKVSKKERLSESQRRRMTCYINMYICICVHSKIVSVGSSLLILRGRTGE